MQHLDSTQADFSAQLENLTAWAEQLDRGVTATVASIIADVIARGDEAGPGGKGYGTDVVMTEL